VALDRPEGRGYHRPMAWLVAGLLVVSFGGGAAAAWLYGRRPIAPPLVVEVPSTLCAACLTSYDSSEWGELDPFEGEGDGDQDHRRCGCGAELAVDRELLAEPVVMTWSEYSDIYPATRRVPRRAPGRAPAGVRLARAGWGFPPVGGGLG